mmetsp:Transcript_36096/g.116734  ORF Transcript_36096/g.116734 Transcript_36096/m.116734 type:complete len:300 (+) Transcript_36096:1399-2298(+)
MFGCFKPLQMSSSTLSFSIAFSPALPVSLATASLTAKMQPFCTSWALRTEPNEPEPMTAPFLHLPITCAGSSSPQPFLCPGALQELGCRLRLPRSVGSGAARTASSVLGFRILLDLVSATGVAAGSRASVSSEEHALPGVGEALASVSSEKHTLPGIGEALASGSPSRQLAGGDRVGKGFELKRLCATLLDVSDTAETTTAPAERLRLSNLRTWRSSLDSGVKGESAAGEHQQEASMKTSGVVHAGRLDARLDEPLFSPVPGEPPSASNGWSLKLGGGSKRKLAPWTSHPACRTPPVRD